MLCFVVNKSFIEVMTDDAKVHMSEFVCLRHKGVWDDSQMFANEDLGQCEKLYYNIIDIAKD